MKEIVQENPLGCGIACTASVLDISYQQALDLFQEGEQKAQTIGFYCKDIANALLKEGKVYQYAHVNSLPQDILAVPGIIVYIKKSVRYPAGHYLVRMPDERWMDPWINFPNLKREAGFRDKLPGKAEWIIYPIV